MITHLQRSTMMEWERERTRERDDIVALIMWENQSIRRNFEANSAPKQLKLNRMTEWTYEQNDQMNDIVSVCVAVCKVVERWLTLGYLNSILDFQSHYLHVPWFYIDFSIQTIGSVFLCLCSHFVCEQHTHSNSQLFTLQAQTPFSF